ncbi:hypothetical protein [Burkholderia glumae]|uniref:hypothetical protein n=1 Tax=Burkholderia glumae TaxID=337 RepID=UPI002150F153|nr:hypothetical protein [Burkholderia glumae]
MTTTNESSKPADGGPAFPIPLQPGQSYQGHAPCDGMTLRDYFAAKAMGAFCQGSEGLGDAPEEKVREAFDAAARFAYMAADSMLRARG